MERREFLLSGAAALLGGCLTRDGFIGERYPGWNPGEMDIHFIHTGVGEQTFFIFPDGTTTLLDCGHVFPRRPGYAEAVPAMPSDRLRGGEWVARYLSRVTDRREIDYVLVSHAHDDHVMGLPDVAKTFAFRHWLDHQYPRVGVDSLDADPDTVRFMREFVPSACTRGMKAEAFAVGALNQIALQHDAARRYGDFEIRNLAANGVLWDGARGTRDYLTEHLRLTGKSGVWENQLSDAIRIRYGNFTYYTGGDVELTLKTSEGEIDWEAAVGRVAGPVDVCKTNHHAFWNAMRPGFVREVRARAYLSSVWSPDQVNDRNLPHVASRDLYPGKRTIFFGAMPKGRLAAFGDAAFVKDFSPRVGHQVVKVAPGGTSYEIFTLDAADESMRVLARTGNN